MTILLAVLLPALAAGFAPAAQRTLGGRSGYLLAGAPAAAFVLLLLHTPGVLAGEAPAFAWSWNPQLGAALAFSLTGLGFLMALLVSGIGTLIAIYAAGYLHGHAQLGRFYTYLLLFTTAMLGLVTADNLILLFVFWELTSITSYFLIAFNHENKQARWNSLQALLVTGLGGVALLGGLILLGNAGGSWSLGALLADPQALTTLTEHPHYPAIAVLVLLGALSKSAQVPLHFWLPNAMAAPTPVSAFLHSATMVKAGVFLLATLTPLLGGTALWNGTLTVLGAATLLTGAVIGLFQRDLKRILAFTTMSVLGMLTLLIGLGTTLSLKAMVVFLLGHALYKAALFMTAGTIDHEAGTRDVTLLGGLRQAMPLTAAAAGLAALSKAGFPPLFGFIGKEYVYKSGTALDDFAPLFVAIMLAGNLMLMALAFKAGIHPFWSRKPAKGTPSHPHEAPPSMVLPPLVLAVTGLMLGLFPQHFMGGLVEAAASGIAGRPVKTELALWHGLNLPLLLSAVTFLAGLSIYLARRRFWAREHLVKATRPYGAEAAYDRAFAGLVWLSKWQTRLLQSGYLRSYVLTVVAFISGTVVWMLARYGGLPETINLAGISPLPAGICLSMMAGALFAVCTNSRLTALVALGLVGFGVASLFLYYGAPDLAITQIFVEALTMVLFMFVVYRLPLFRRFSKRSTEITDAFFAGAVGLLITSLVLKTLDLQLAPSIASNLAELSYTEAKGRNVVNVILVDFRALDTLGEITVLGIAALGVAALLQQFRNSQDKPATKEEPRA